MKKLLQVKIIEIFEQLANEKAIHFLRKKINYPNKNIRNRIIKALGHLNYQAGKLEKPFISTRLEEEIRNFVYVTASLNDLGSYDNSNEIINSLQNDKIDKIDNIFILLSVLYDASAIQLIRENFESDNPDASGYALEIADTVISEIHKEFLIYIVWKHFVK